MRSRSFDESNNGMTVEERAAVKCVSCCFLREQWS